MGTNDIRYVCKRIKGGIDMPIRDRIEAMDYPYNVACEVLTKIIPKERFQEDLPGSIEYILYTAISERQREIIIMHWKYRMTLEEIGEKMNLSKQSVREKEHKAFRILRNPKWSRFVILGVIGVIEHEKFKTKEIERGIKESDKYWKEHPYEIPLHELEFCVRIYNSLRRANIENCGDIVKNMESNCCKNIRNLGKKSIIEILNKLDKLGIEINNMPEVFEKWNITRKDLHG